MVYHTSKEVLQNILNFQLNQGCSHLNLQVKQFMSLTLITSHQLQTSLHVKMILTIYDLTEFILKETRIQREKVDTTQFETRISQLQQELEMWRRKYLTLQYQSDKALNVEQTVKNYFQILKIHQLEGRIRILLEENKLLNGQLKDKINENERQRLKIQQQDLEIHQLSLAALEVERLHDLLQQKQGEVDDWRKRYQILEQQFQQFKGFEITLLEYEGKMKGIQQQSDMWRDRYDKLLDEFNKQKQELKKANDTLSMYNLNTSQTTKLQAVKSLDNENDRLREQLLKIMIECDEWRKKALSLELQLFDYSGRYTDELNRNKMLQAEIDRLNGLILLITQEISQLKTDNLSLLQKVEEIVILQQQVQQFQEIIELKNQDNDRLIQLNGNLEVELQNLRHESLLRLELENKLRYAEDEIERLQQQLSDQTSELDQLRDRNVKLEQQNGEYKHQLLLNEQLYKDHLHLKIEYQILQQQCDANEAQKDELRSEIQSLQTKIQEYKVNEAELIRLRLTLDARDIDVEELRQKIAELIKKCRVIKEQEEQIRDLNKQIPSWKIQIEHLEETNQNLSNDKEDLQKQNSLLDQELAQKLFIENQLKEVRDQLDGSIQEVSLWKAKYEKAMQEVKLCKAERDDFEQRSRLSNIEANKYKELLDSNKRTTDEWRAKASQLGLELDKLQKQLQDIQEASGLKEEENEQIKSLLKQKEGDLDRTKLQNDQLLRELDLNQLNHRSDLLNQTHDIAKTAALLTKNARHAEELNEKYLKSQRDIQAIKDKYNDNDKAKENIKQ